MCILLVATVLFWPLKVVEGQATGSQAARIASLDETTAKYDLSPVIDILEDPLRTLTVEEVATPTWDSRFVPNRQPIPNLGFSNSAFWLRVTVQNLTLARDEYVLELAFPRLTRVDFYQPQTAGESGERLKARFSHQVSGAEIAFVQREVKHHNLIFNVHIKPREVKTLYLRVTARSALTFPLTLWSREALVEKDRTEVLILGMYYGILLVMVVYNTFLFVVVRDRNYLLYVLVSTGIGVLQFAQDGFASAYLWPESSYWASHAILVLASLSAVFVVFFAQEYLLLRRNAPGFNKFLHGFNGLNGCAVVFFLVSYNVTLHKLETFGGILLFLILLAGTILCMQRKYRPARFYLLSVVSLAAGFCISLMRNFGFFPDNFLTHYSIHIGTAVDVVLLSIGLADRINLLQAEKQEAETVAALKEKDVELFRLRNEELSNINHKLKELDQLKVGFTAMLVHDLKSPLTVVRTTLDMFKSKDLPAQVLNELLTTSERNVDRILTLVNEVLELYRTEAQGLQVKLEPVAPEPFLSACARSAQLAASPQSITVEFRRKTSLPPISADLSQLERVFSNLLSNAIKFTAPGGAVVLEAAAVQGSGVEFGLTKLVVSVTDTGEGIAPEAIPYIFEPYRQAEAGRKKIGVGLGLAIVKRIVAAHGGNISVRSQLGVGSSFTVVLPAVSAVPDEQGWESVAGETSIPNSLLLWGEKAAESAAAIPRFATQPFILVADDNPINRKVVQMQLKKLGCEVETVANGLEVLEALSRKSFDLVFLDCRMPEMDGFETAAAIRQREQGSGALLLHGGEPAKDGAPAVRGGLPRLPVVALTASSIDGRDSCLAAGMDDFLEKPFKSEELAAILARWLPVSFEQAPQN
ncbi:MAG: response regulator [Blastocatellia bacterium]|nr:response regulator [Blastocatellia bacterium]